MVTIKENDKAMLLHESGYSYMVDIAIRTFHSQFGALSLKDLIGKEYDKRYETSSGDHFLVIRPDFKDKIRKILKRGPQIIHPKDVGMIISYCGIGKNSKILEAGCGSAHLTSHLGNIAKKVKSWEKNNKHYKIASSNIEKMGLSENVEVSFGDIYQETENDYDTIILDMPMPEKTIEKVTDKLKLGGRMAVYSPCIEQSTASINTLEELGYTDINFMECMIRNWENEKCIRPKTTMIGHTGFLVFARKIRE